jgi:type I restriction-modification system DNA methylase subunit
MENIFFSKYVKNANSFYDVLKNGTVENLSALLKDLEKKFNGDIFILTREKNERITKEIIRNIVNIVSADTDEHGQLYFWNIYNFEHILVEVISHISQYFTEKGQGAVFTPMLLVNLMLDQVMPLEILEGNEKIFDPTCGSGIFLVSAFRRLVYINQQKNNNQRVTPQELITLLRNTIFGV